MGTTSFTAAMLGQAPGLCSRAAMLLAAATALPWGQPAPTPTAAPPPPPPPPPGAAQLGNSRGIFLHLCWLLAVWGPVSGPQTVPGGPGCPALVLSISSPASSLCIPSQWLTYSSLGKYFLEHLLRARHCLVQPWTRQTLALVEHTLGVQGSLPGLEYPSLCLQLLLPPLQALLLWQTILTLQKLAPVSVVSGTV